MIKIYYYDLNDFDLLNDNLDQYLSDFNKHYISQVNSNQAKKRIIGILLRNYALFEQNINLNLIDIEFNKFGKPYLSRGKFFYNISHSKKIVVCALSDNEVGIDIQFLEKMDISPIISLLHKKEQTQIHSLEDFIKLWTIKESYLKYLGTGLYKPLNSFYIENNCIFDNKIKTKYKTFKLQKNYWITVVSNNLDANNLIIKKVDSKNLLKIYSNFNGFS